MRRTTLLLAVLAVSSLVAVACARETIESFPWIDGDGSRLALSQAASWPKGEEGRFRQDRLKNRYRLESAKTIQQGEDLEIELRTTASTRPALAGPRLAKISASLRPDGAEPYISGSFPLRADGNRFILPLSSGNAATVSRLTSLSIEIEAFEGDGTVEIVRIAFLPFFRGFEIREKGTRVSADFSLQIAESRTFAALNLPGATTLSPAGPGSPRGDDAYRRALVIEYGANPAGSLIHIDSVTARGEKGGATEKKAFTLRTRIGGGRSIIDLELLPPGAIRLEFVLPASISLRALYVSSIPAAEAELADLGRLLLSPRSTAGPDYDLYRWELLPAILVLDFRNYERQDAYLKRLAFFVEKKGYRGKLAKDEEIAPLHGWNAHDYRTEDLAAFFEAARSKSFKLGKEERLLEELLLKRGLIVDSGNRIAAGKGALISISKESPAYLRTMFLVHESTHALFFVDAAYRDHVRSLWAGIKPEEKWFWKLYFGWMNYDTLSDYLMANEFQAYLMQQPLSRAEEYFTKTLPARLLENHAELKPRIEAYMKEYGPDFVVRAGNLEAWLAARYGITAGKSYFLY